MNNVSPLWRVIVAPRRTITELLDRSTFRGALAVVVGFGAVVGLLFLRSALARDWPPPPGEFKTWIDAYGEFSQVPFVKIPIEQYRLVQAIGMVPFVFAVWLLMAGTARVLTGLMGGRTSFDRYLTVFAYTYFAWWIVATVGDMGFSLAAGARFTPMLRGEYGQFWRLVTCTWQPMIWVVSVTLGGAYNAWAVKIADGFGWLKAAIVGAATAAWPIVLISLFVR